MTVDRLNADLLKALPDDGPVTMLNLMRFRDRSLVSWIRSSLR